MDRSDFITSVVDHPMTLYLAQRLMTHIGTSAGIDIKVRDDAAGCVGVMAVFRTKTAARKWYGKNVELRELWVDDELLK